MRQIQRSSDAVEIHSEQAISYAVGGIAGLLVAGLLFYYRGSTEMFVPLAIVITILSIGSLSYGASCALQIRKVQTVNVVCPYCQKSNHLTEIPNGDFTCNKCFRLIPVIDGEAIAVSQVRCGFCNELNFYSSKTEVLLCESCNHEIPISRVDGQPSTKTASLYAAQNEDTDLYELVLIAHGMKTEGLVECLQKMLALNRNQVKQMLSELPVTLLTGIPKRKAEMLRAQISVHDGAADFHPVASSTRS